MAGHSKWAQIKRTKAVVDAKRGAVFTRLGREISVAARGGADPSGNFQLRTAIEKAKAAGVPNANIERAILKGSGQLSGGGEQFADVRYEGYGPGGVAVLIEAFTDNRNRTAADVRLAFNKHGGNLGESGCVSYLFEQRGVVSLGSPLAPERLELSLLEGLEAIEAAGGPPTLDYELQAGGVELQCHFSALEALQEALQGAGFTVEGWEHRWIPQTPCPLHEAEQLRGCLGLLDALEDLDDVRGVTSNLEAEDALLEALMAE
ncbi:YebC/PmpR family DNA-binding transcriptional regulator [Cyanobium sp. LEGE 06143]|jgi:YebC/PmpR family DNA-binding regulatory protein|uniref:YebC/PmpR family DNA-binding transcriptional regulator n=1 Tax=Cyanobium sp. LEGE 06143 TaxID=945727 RepID=UPI001881A7A2|nr:YebC/PmpR family DNA-binding transcriptional regulator [Cyanobium sp. LEGE 06143]MBE9172088.1 YebC/PmpR family DNA-binding transcriptional regulator [Cyanobium sp. LEGE 06143]